MNSYEFEDGNTVKKLSDVYNEINEYRKSQDRSNYKILEPIEEENIFMKAERKAKNRLKRFIAMDLIIMISISFSVFANYIFAFTSDESDLENVKAVAGVEFEANSGAIDIENVLLENVSILKTKKLIEEPAPVEFETEAIPDENLPLDEKIVVQEGKVGSKNVTVIKTFENDEMVDENLIEEKITEEPIKAVVRVGTSEFLKNNQIHLGDTIYVTSDTNLKQTLSPDSADVTTIPSSLEVVLMEIHGDYCKVEYDGTSGYVKKDVLTSSTATPTIIEANRIQKLLLPVNEKMALNKSSGLTLQDFKKILSGNSRDRNGIFEDAAEDFYKADITYNVNGVFLAAIGIHESAWGSSKIAQDKKNLFGYGAYDWSPYESAYTFETYYEGIEILANALTKNYLNPPGTILKNGETANGVYYNGNNVAGVNIRYASDPNWHNCVYEYMETLYKRLK